MSKKITFLITLFIHVLWNNLYAKKIDIHVVISRSNGKSE